MNYEVLHFKGIFSFNHEMNTIFIYITWKQPYGNLLINVVPR